MKLINNSVSYKTVGQIEKCANSSEGNRKCKAKRYVIRRIENGQNVVI